MNNCCQNCFQDWFVRRLIRRNGAKGYCAFCSTERSKVLPARDLRDVFSPLLELYEPAKAGIHYVDDGFLSVSSLAECVDSEGGWGVLPSRRDKKAKAKCVSPVTKRNPRQSPLFLTRDGPHLARTDPD